MARTPDTDQPSRFAALSDDAIRAQTDDGSFTRGRSYFRGGHIVEPALRGDTIEAQCLGSEPHPYHVTATLALAGTKRENPVAASCTCPRGGFCKHIVALLLTWVDQPERFEERPSVAEQLAERSREELAALIERMVQRHPDLERLIELPMPIAPGASSDVPANVVTVDVKAIRRQARTALASYDEYEHYHDWSSWGGGPAVPGEITTILELGQSYISAGQWANAQAVFATLAEETTDVLPNISDESGEFTGIVIDADEGLAACLDAQPELPEGQRLAPSDREDLLRAIYAIWRCDVFDIGGIDLSPHGTDALVRNATAAELEMVEGWLREEAAADDWRKRAVVGFLSMLREARGASEEEILALYRDAELWDEVATMLLSMGRIDEAVATAGRHIKLSPRLLAFANALIALGGEHASRAIALVDDLLWEIDGTSAGHEDALRTWLMGQYGGHGRPRDALAMAERRFEKQQTAQTYAAVKETAALPELPANTWDELRPMLFERLREQQRWNVLLDIHLREGDAAAALDAYDRLQKQAGGGVIYGGYGWASYDDPELQLARLVTDDVPDRAVAIYRRRAEREIGRRSRSNYKLAAEHLARVRETLERHDRTDDWRALIAEVRETHRTLRALREELDALGL